MDYVLRHDASDLESTGYIEIGPGKYDGKHWQAGFIFVWEDAFGMAEGTLARHLPEYDHFDMNDVPRAVGRAVIADWRVAAERLPHLAGDEAHNLLNLEASYGSRLDEEVVPHRAEIAAMLRQLADTCERFYEQSDWICVLGM
jgi:hypothetical protein